MVEEITLEQRVAEISTWRNNCALSCTSVFLIDAFISRKLSENAEKNLLDLFNSFYQVVLSIEQLRDIFLSVITLPFDRQVILGSALRYYIVEIGVPIEEENMLSNEAFQSLAEQFDFNVVFYANLEGRINESGAIPPITIDQSFRLTLRPYYHGSHYDLIMDNHESALIFNRLYNVSSLQLPINAFNPISAIKKRVKEIVLERYNPDQQTKLNRLIEKLWLLAENVGKVSEEDAKKIAQLFDNLQNLCDVFFKKPIPERVVAIDAFKQDITTLVNENRFILGNSVSNHGLIDRVADIATPLLSVVSSYDIRRSSVIVTSTLDKIKEIVDSITVSEPVPSSSDIESLRKNF